MTLAQGIGMNKQLITPLQHGMSLIIPKITMKNVIIE